MKTVQRFLCIACLVGASHAVEASNPKVDSLLQVLQSNPRDRAEVLWGIAYELFDVDNVQALFYAERAYQEVWKRGDSLQIVKVGTTYGQLLRRMDEVTKSIEVSELMLTIAKRHDYRKYTKMLLNSLGTSNVFIGSYSLALEYQLESLDTRKKDSSDGDVILALHSLGVLYYKVGDPVLAKKYFKEAWYLTRKKNMEVDEVLESNIGFCFTEMREYDSALIHHGRAITRSIENGNPYIELASDFGMGEALAGMKDHTHAQAYFVKSLRKSRKHNDGRYEALSLIYLADVALSQSRLGEAKIYLDQAYETWSFHDPGGKMRYLKIRSQFALRVGDTQNAHDYLKEYIALRDSLFFSEEMNKLRRLQASYDEKESHARIEDQNKILELNGELIAKQRLLILLGSLVALLLAGVTVVLYRANKAKNRITRILDERVQERTIELSRHRDALQHAHDEQNLGRKRVSEEIISAVASLKGIFHVGEKELPEAYLPYFEQARLTTDKIESAINRYRSNDGRNS